MANPELARLIEVETAAEASRVRAHRREADRHRGVAWAACGPEAYAPRSPQDLARQAQGILEARAAWRESAAGRFLNAVVEGQSAAASAHQACERARAAWSRDFAGEAEACAAAAQELEHQARRLGRSARLAWRALRDDQQA